MFPSHIWYSWVIFFHSQYCFFYDIWLQVGICKKISEVCVKKALVRKKKLSEKECFPFLNIFCSNKLSNPGSSPDNRVNTNRFLFAPFLRDHFHESAFLCPHISINLNALPKPFYWCSWRDIDIEKLSSSHWGKLLKSRSSELLLTMDYCSCVWARAI